MYFFILFPLATLLYINFILIAMGFGLFCQEKNSILKFICWFFTVFSPCQCADFWRIELPEQDYVASQNVVHSTFVGFCSAPEHLSFTEVLQNIGINQCWYPFSTTTGYLWLCEKSFLFIFFERNSFLSSGYDDSWVSIFCVYFKALKLKNL